MAKNNIPDYIASAKNLDGKWVRIGCAWKSRTTDGNKEYIGLKIDSLPLQFDGKISMFENDRKQEDDE